MRRISSDPSSDEVRFPSTITAFSLIVAGTVARLLCSRQIASREKNPLRIRDKLRSYPLFIFAPNAGYGANDLGDIQGFIALPPMRHWRDIGRVSFGKKHIKRSVFYDLVVVVGKGENARK